jgi:hypothetical protein
MRILLRIGLASLAATELGLGLWTALFPRSFYDNFPTVNLTPPFSEHFLRDFGGATLGIAVVLVAAIIWPQTKLVIVALAAYLAFAGPHLAFHAGHLDGATGLQATVLVSVLASWVVIPLLLIWLAIALELRARRGLARRNTPRTTQ